MLNVYLCCTLQPANTNTGAKAPHKVTCTQPVVSPCMLHPALSLPELNAGCWQSQTGKMLCLAQTEVLIPVGEHTTASNQTPLVLTACSVLTVLPPVTKFHLSLILLSKLAPALFQNSLCNSLVTV